MKIEICLIYLILLFVFSQQSLAQINKYSGRTTTEKFDINKFNELKAENRDEEILADGSIVTYEEYSTGFQEKIKEPNSNYTIVKQYFKSNLSLKREEYFFTSMESGKMQEYNVSGKLIYEVNYDTIYKFSLLDVSNFLFKHYNIRIFDEQKIYNEKNIFDDRKFDIKRAFWNGSAPYYDITISSGRKLHIIFLNGNTGEVMSEYNEFIHPW